MLPLDGGSKMHSSWMEVAKMLTIFKFSHSSENVLETAISNDRDCKVF